MNTPHHPAFSRNLFPWTGSKRRLSKEIIARLPAHECYCEPFAGSAAVFFRKPPSGLEILNDVCGDIVNLFRVIQRHLPEFLRMFDYTIVARQEFYRLRATPPEVLTDIERAARFYYLQKCSFGGKYASLSFGVETEKARTYLQRDKMRQDLTAACARLEDVRVENLPWQECLARYDRAYTLFFMDPPYFQQFGYGVAARYCALMGYIQGWGRKRGTMDAPQQVGARFIAPRTVANAPPHQTGHNALFARRAEGGRPSHRPNVPHRPNAPRTAAEKPMIAPDAARAR